MVFKLIELYRLCGFKPINSQLHQRNANKNEQIGNFFIETNYELFFTARKMRFVNVCKFAFTGRCIFAALLALFPDSVYQRRSVAWSIAGS